MSKDPYRYFRIEAQELLGRITGALERMRHEPATGEGLRELRRCAHTLKGAAQVVRRADIAQEAHRLETVLDGWTAGGVDPTAALTVTGNLARQLEPLRIPWPGEEAAKAGAGPSEILSPMPPHTIRNADATSENAAEKLSEESPGMYSEKWRREYQIAAQDGVRDRQNEDREQDAKTLRVELHSLDLLMQGVNESAVAVTALRTLFDPLKRARDLSVLLRRGILHEGTRHPMQQVDAVADEIQDLVTDVRRRLDLATGSLETQLHTLHSMAEDLRLVEAGTVTTSIERSLRAAAEVAGKSVHFAFSGGEFALDADVLLKLRDALTQIARNAVAHGIESEEERKAAGKPSSGQVRLEMLREGARNIFRITDDGRGIDLEKLRAEAVRRGWLTTLEAGMASARELTEFLLRPGVTTVDSPTELAGRGIGLDVVNSTVAQLKGELRIKAEPGKGTTMELRIPTRISSAAILLVQASGMVLGIPLDAVRKTTPLAHLPRLADRYVVEGRPLIMTPLGKVFGMQPGILKTAIEIDAEPHPFLLGVDGLLGIEQSIIHSLPDYMQTEAFVLGASIDRQGAARLILDPAFLAATLEEDGEWERAFEPSPQLPILVIDDSLTTRMLEQSIFEAEGYAVELASSGEEALAMARRTRYGLFLVDIEMPGMDGFAFIGRAQQEAELREVPAILVSSRGSEADRVRGRQAGAKDYIVKGEFDQRYLLRRARELMGPG